MQVPTQFYFHFPLLLISFLNMRMCCSYSISFISILLSILYFLLLIFCSYCTRPSTLLQSILIWFISPTFLHHMGVQRSRRLDIACDGSAIAPRPSPYCIRIGSSWLASLAQWWARLAPFTIDSANQLRKLV